MAAAPSASDAHYTSFPAVRTDELLAVLHEMGVQVTAEDMARPQGAMAQTVYLAFLDTLSGVLPETLERLRAAAMANMEHADMLQDSVGWLIFFREVRAMMEAATVHDFCIQDLTRPQPKRFKRHMSALVNFFRFRSDRLAEFDEMVAETEDLEVQKLDLEDEIAQARTHITELRSLRAAEAPEVERLRAENLARSEELLSLKREQNRLLAEVDSLKNSKTALLQRQADTEHTQQQLAAEIAKLEARIATPPEDMAADVAAMEARVAGKRQALAESEQRVRELQGRLDVCTRRTNDIASLLGVIENVRTEMERQASEARALDAARSALASAESENGALAQRCEQLERQLGLGAERLARTKASLEEQRAAGRARLEALHERLQEVARARRERAAKIEACASECAALEARLEAMLQSHEAYYARMQLEKDNCTCPTGF
ncbi:kinetochore-associated Ndc80 complex subunit nuf2 [Malassezia cuniculi]|uniref:Kinetochore-associated Ndc80 complex subunit nuf2 n=1 Tax=Malassezia cuniculi TaxID=948313 RepID=A0AAF0J6T4_9BASI|nr:kinetochore-associated Ndc80 complex subunit nuf2 [Malassezia cuniculi]